MIYLGAIVHCFGIWEVHAKSRQADRAMLANTFPGHTDVGNLRPGDANLGLGVWGLGV